MQDSQCSKSCSSNISKKKNKITQTFDSANPPEAITWVLSDAENNDWSPFTGETMAPEIVKNHWAETFICINEENNNPIFRVRCFTFTTTNSYHPGLGCLLYVIISYKL